MELFSSIRAIQQYPNKKINPCKVRSVMDYVVYMLRTSSGTLYTGYTQNLEKRLLQHLSKTQGSKYLKSFSSFTLVHTEKFETKSEAMRREAQIKKLSKTEKEKLVAKE